MTEHTLVGFNAEQMAIIQQYRRNEAEMTSEIRRQRAEFDKLRTAVLDLKNKIQEGYALARHDQKPLSLVEALEFGNILERIDAIIDPPPTPHPPTPRRYPQMRLF